MGVYLDHQKPMGKNVKELWMQWAAADAIHTGDAAPFFNGLSVLSDKTLLKNNFRQALIKVEDALAAIKSSPDNPYGDDDEVIAGEILRRLVERDKELRKNASRRNL